VGDLASGGIIILFIVGIVLVFAELLMPTVIFGMIGVGCVIVAVVMAFITQPETALGVWLLVTALVVFPIVVLLWIKLMGRYLSIKGTQAGYDSSEEGIDELVGQEGVTLTMLRPTARSSRRTPGSRSPRSAAIASSSAPGGRDRPGETERKPPSPGGKDRAGRTAAPRQVVINVPGWERRDPWFLRLCWELRMRWSP